MKMLIWKSKSLKTLHIFALLLGLYFVAGCTTQDWPLYMHSEGQGGIDVTLQGSQTRASTSVITKDEADLFLVTLTKGEDIISQQLMLGKLGTVTFPAGYGYKVFVENITSEDAINMNDGWGAKRYTGESKSFGIQAGQTTKVSVGCEVANAAVAVNIDSSAEGCVVTLKTSDGRTLTTTESRVAYVNITPEEKPNVTVTIEKDGEIVTEKTLEDLDAAQIKDINIKESNEGELGLTVTYDDHFEIVESDINIETE